VAAAATGDKFATLVSGTDTYRDVVVLSTTESTITIRHARGISQVGLRTLSPEMQAVFHYNPARDAAHREKVEEAIRAQTAAALAKEEAARIARARTGAAGAIDRALGHFGTAPALRNIDLRADFQSLNLGAKSQGRRPSCAIHAVVGALEYGNSRVVGRVERYSEDYLIWATRRVTGRIDIQDMNTQDSAIFTAFFDQVGFKLGEVLTALRNYGIPTAEEMPNTIDSRMSQIPEPSPDVIQAAKEKRRVHVQELPGPSRHVLVDNIIHVLNESVPVVVGFAWPSTRDSTKSSIGGQDPVSPHRHAVTIVGYITDNGERDGVRFFFRNSWGQEWGDNGYGAVSLTYLEKSVMGAAVVEVLTAGR
jgi:hypothetical protein